MRREHVGDVDRKLTLRATPPATCPRRAGAAARRSSVRSRRSGRSSASVVRHRKMWSTAGALTHVVMKMYASSVASSAIRRRNTSGCSTCSSTSPMTMASKLDGSRSSASKKSRCSSVDRRDRGGSAGRSHWSGRCSPRTDRLRGSRRSEPSSTARQQQVSVAWPDLQVACRAARSGSSRRKNRAISTWFGHRNVEIARPYM